MNSVESFMTNSVVENLSAYPIDYGLYQYWSVWARWVGWFSTTCFIGFCVLLKYHLFRDISIDVDSEEADGAQNKKGKKGKKSVHPALYNYDGKEVDNRASGLSMIFWRPWLVIMSYILLVLAVAPFCMAWYPLTANPRWFAIRAVNLVFNLVVVYQVQFHFAGDWIRMRLYACGHRSYPYRNYDDKSFAEMFCPGGCLHLEWTEAWNDKDAALGHFMRHDVYRLFRNLRHPIAMMDELWLINNTNHFGQVNRGGGNVVPAIRIQ